MAKYTKADNFTLNLPKNRYQLRIDKRNTYSIVELDSVTSKDGERIYNKDFVIYIDTEKFNDKLMRMDTNRELVEDGLTSLSKAKSRINDIVSNKELK